MVTALETNMSPETQWLEDVFPTEKSLFRGHVSFPGCSFSIVIRYFSAFFLNLWTLRTLQVELPGQDEGGRSYFFAGLVWLQVSPGFPTFFPFVCRVPPPIFFGATTPSLKLAPDLASFWGGPRPPFRGVGLGC